MNKLVAGGGRMDVMLQTWHRLVLSAISMDGDGCHFAPNWSY
ncbi:hypothetical protein [Chromatium okenii]|nr:hypothetical protein [Chromatium okenii]